MERNKKTYYVNFYPKFIEDKIVELPVEYTYPAFAPWNPKYSLDKLQKEIRDFYIEEFGDNYLEIPSRNNENGNAYVWVDGNRRLSVYKNIMRNSDNSYDKIGSIVYNKYTTKSSSKLIVSNIDNETVIESENSGNIPIYTKPKYCPFGLGYRRCAGENFSYFVTKHLCDVFFKYKYKEKGKLGREKTKRKIEAKTKIGLFNMVTNNKLLV